MDHELGRLILLLHAAVTCYMVGVIWFVQVVHYPLLARIRPEDVPGYERAHTRRTAWVVGPAMLIELLTGVGLLWVRPVGVPLELAMVGVGLIVVNAVSTQLVQVPCHTRLCAAFAPGVHRRLVRSNWVRTVAWSARGVLVMGWLL